ncbi:origin recognition complex subunit 2-like [Ruditapes philippinarum]|uniref:origin recognition complex subunit 2-like n=1 Tax=Ruditapes philippinarum TaxID=129788 RepID=UPI00295AEC48|nr:origin recognition complex subunit 2-like [Ruditapes philippinarum]
MSDRKLRRKSVNVTFAGDDEVLQHIVDAHNQKVKPTSKSRRKSCPERVKTIEEEEEEDHGDNENLPLKKSTALEDESQLCGGEVYGFKTPKKSGQMAQLASESRTPKSILKTPVTKEGTPKKSVNFPSTKNEEMRTPTGKRNLRHRKLQASTPYRLQKRHGAGDSDSSDSMESSSSDSDEDIKPVSSTSKSRTSSASASNTPANTPAKSEKSSATPRKSRRKTEEIDMKTNVEEYFDIHASDVGPTSDATLSKLDVPRLDQESLINLLENVQSSHINECKQMFHELQDMFTNWMFQMCNGFNILLYGFGSKRNLMEKFRSTTLKGFSQLVVNGYFPSLTIKHILNSITEDIFGHNGSFKNPLDQCEFIKKEFEKSGQDFYVIIHNIDGTMLRNDKSQNILSLLCQVPGLHMIASVDHINSSLIWDQTKCSRFRWLWYDATTFAPYTEETSYENSILVQQSGALALSSLTHVMKSLTPNAKGIFLLLARNQLEHKDSTNYIGMSLQELYQRCREAFLVNSDLTLQAQLTEFRDHKMIRSKKSLDGVEHLHIPIDEGTLKEFVDEHTDD